MQILALLMLVAVTTFEYFAVGNRATGAGWAPSWLPYTIEITSLIALAAVVLLGARDRFRNVRPEYWIALGGLLLVMLCGIIVNTVEPGPIFAGLRTYLRALPWFFLPAVFAFTEKQIRVQLLILLLIGFVQFPLAWEQRAGTRFQQDFTGDWTSGTLLISSIMSIYVIAAAFMLAAAYVKKRISLFILCVAFALLLAPTTINETKATLVFLPLGLLIVMAVAGPRGAALKNSLVAVVILGAFGAIFVQVYDVYIQDRPWGGKPISSFLERDRLEGYIYRRETVGTTEQVGRIDALIVPVSSLAADPSHLAFGLGIGNASHSALGPQFTGKYFEKFEPFLITSVSRLQLEVGTLGLLAVFGFIWLVFKDARVVAASDQSLFGVLASGWVAISVVFALGLFYKNILDQASLSYLFFYWSGVVAAHRMRMQAGTSPAVSSTDPRVVQNRSSLLANSR